MKLYALLTSITISVIAMACLHSTETSASGTEGVLHFRAYTAQQLDTFNFNRAVRVIDTVTYFIKQDQVFRKSYPVKQERSEIKDASGKTVIVEMDFENPQYLIDFKRSVYHCYSSEGKKIIEKPLKEMKSDMLFFPGIQGKSNLQLLSFDSVSLKGLAIRIDTRDTVVFKCSKKSLPLKSPLNEWIPGVKYDITALSIGAKSTGQASGVSWLTMEVYDLKNERNVQDFLVDLSNSSK